ncbi:MAG TPA: hypothetical protein VJ866_14285 [Pyrinomonadaceae bacterium]|nr:hypothetical protein [Pyrinomonadaceae bacterium]
MGGKRKARLSITFVARFPKENTLEEIEYLAAALLSIVEKGKHPIPPPPPDWEDGREIVEITEELYTDGTKKFISREEKLYRKPEMRGGKKRRER